MTSLSLQTKILRKKKAQDEYRVYRAGLEWDLTDPIVIENHKDLKSEYRWRDRITPYYHQVANLITFCRRLPVTLLADDVGLGKTISAGLIISELIARSRLSKILVVCPKLLGPQWQEEFATKFDIPSTIAIGRELLDADPEEIGAVITTYHSARMYLDSIPEDRFQMLVLDEAHKLRNLYGVEKPPQVAKRFRLALEKRQFRFVLMLTATPIQNRLWDIYSLIDLLTVARGHQNPFGREGMFARKFIADNKDQARQLRPEAREEFRSIVYGYMSRVRRGDAKLYFPERVVQMHKVEPTAEELELIRAIAAPIQKLNRLAQISILQALSSSPDALLAQLKNMARNGTVSQELATTVDRIVSKISVSAKLRGLSGLIENLKKENLEQWRLVIFTGRLETQTTIQSFLENNGLKVGIINGLSGVRNQDTVARFRKNPPECHVIVSTEAGSEGVNLQVANVLVNYDLPWNPMIVEQRIGRVQRLASQHASVGIFNIMLLGTFEEYIVGRLMEKLQMASHAIGDIEALLEASGISGDDENGNVSFDERIRQLVIAALAGKDVQEDIRLQEQSILEANATLARERENIDSMLGAMEGAEHAGPRAPNLPATVRSMESRDFTLMAMKVLGAILIPEALDSYILEDNGRRERIHFDRGNNSRAKSTSYAPGSPAFLRLVNQIVTTGIHDVGDLDEGLSAEYEQLIRQWVATFNGEFKKADIKKVQRNFTGKAIIRARATVAHDSYERLIEIPCATSEHNSVSDSSWLAPLPRILEDPKSFGVNGDKLVNAAMLDEGISEFSRFYMERRALEIQSAGSDERKRKKLEDDFTPRIVMTLVALEGTVNRHLEVYVEYIIDHAHTYHSSLTVIPSEGEIANPPTFDFCAESGRSFPKNCLKKCDISKANVLEHLLVQSELSARLALPKYTVRCSLSGKCVLEDEAELSSISGQLIASSLLKTSFISGKRGEPQYFDQCEFTKIDALTSELEISEVSGKCYRKDQQVQSVVSGKTGHKSEFISCHETRQPILPIEAETCEVTRKFVRPGILEKCAITQMRVLPLELERCAATGKRALKRHLVTSNLSAARILEEVAVRSVIGNFCAPVEAKSCYWSGRKCHPEDIRICSLIALPVHFEFTIDPDNPKLQQLVDLLNGTKRARDKQDIWEKVANKISEMLGHKKCQVEAAVLSPSGQYLAACSEVRTLLGLRIRQAGVLYAVDEHSIEGQVVLGRRTANRWLKITDS